MSKLTSNLPMLLASRFLLGLAVMTALVCRAGFFAAKQRLVGTLTAAGNTHKLKHACNTMAVLHACPSPLLLQVLNRFSFTIAHAVLQH